MPELKHNFLKGRMNLDLDERLVPDGEYREAMNIEVSTSESSNVGTAQVVMGNILSSQTILDNYGGTVVGSYADTASDKIYYFITCNTQTFTDPNNSVYSGSGLSNDQVSFKKDMIVEYNAATGVTVPVVVDVYEVQYFLPQNGHPVAQSFYGASSSNWDHVHVSHMGNPTTNITNIREDMKVAGTLTAPAAINPSSGLNFSVGDYMLLHHPSDSATSHIAGTGQTLHPVNFGPFHVYNITQHAGFGWNVYIRASEFSTPTDFLLNSLDDNLTFISERTLNFSTNRLIDSINIIDGILFYTDGFSEPKKINIKRSKQGTPSFDIHSNFIVIKENGSIQSQKPMKEEHITVIKKSPLTAPNLELHETIDGRGGKIRGLTTNMNFTNQLLDDPVLATYDIEPFANDTILVVDFISNMSYIEGDILIFSNTPSAVSASDVHFYEWQVRAIILENITSSQVKIKILSTSPTLTDWVSGGETWGVDLEQPDSLYEFKFPRFAYRYKYQDGEYSCFSPFSEVAFLPGMFDFLPKEAYNLGMTNNLRFLKIKDFVPDGMPKGVVEVDILYKESNSPNVYTVKTIKSTDPEWSATGSGGATKGSFSLESEMIYATVPSNQLLRPWDNVPRWAKTQEISGNRIVYANYLQNYNLPSFGGQLDININTFIKSKTKTLDSGEIYSSGRPGESIKSLRTYQLGIIYKDIYGRETPVLTNEKASVKVTKPQAVNFNNLVVQNKHHVWPFKAPDWADSYKYFVKETSNEYYNLAMDRWYDAQDGGIWLSFPSAERNKVDEDTYLILKKAHDSPAFVPERARFKVVAIENEAPDWIKTEFTSFGSNNVVAQTASNTVGELDVSFQCIDWEETAFEGQVEGEKGLWVRLYLAAGATTDWYKVKSIAVNKVAPTTGHIATITIKGQFGEFVESVTGSGGTDDFLFELRQEKVHELPEFQGKFFVKIRGDDGDGVIGNYIKPDIEGGDQTIYKTRQKQRQYYIYSCGIDNSWAQEEQWFDKWAATLGDVFFIDEANRDWGQVPSKGPWPTQDNGWGISGYGTSTRANQSLESYLELSLSGLNDGNHEGFTLSGISTEKKNFYNAMGKVGTLFKWTEDPDGIVYRITQVRKKGSSTYDNNHGSGIYNYKGSKKARQWKSNKTLRLYITFVCDGALYDSGTVNTVDSTEYSTGGFSLKDSAPPWITTAQGGPYGYNTNAADCSFGLNFRPTHKGSGAAGTSALGVSIAQESANDNGCHDYQNDSGGTGCSDVNNPANGNAGYTLGGSPSCSIGTSNVFYNQIEILEKTTYSAEIEYKPSEDPAIWETEPKEDIGLDIYHEIDQSMPITLNGDTNELLAPVGSTISSDWIDPATGAVANFSKLTLLNPTTPYTAKWTISEALITMSGSVGSWVKPGYRVEETATGNFLGNVNSVSGPFDPSGSIIGLDTVLTNTQASFLNISIFKTEPAKITSWDDNIARTNVSISDVTVPSAMYGTTIPATNINNVTFTKPDGSSIQATLIGLTFVTSNNNAALIFDRDVSAAQAELNWSNCFSFGNGVESNRIRDDYNAVTLDKGPKVSTTLDKKYKEEERKNSLIWSGIYNSTSGTNNTNQFIMAESIVKDINPRFGSIQKIHSRDTDLITLCEDKILKILANKDALYNADGNVNVTSNLNVLGAITPFFGEYGISRNPESFASQAYTCYWTDKARGVVLRLSGSNITPISDHGLKDWFSDNLRDAGVGSKLIGTYDTKKESYNISLTRTTGIPETTVSFGEKTNGWTSFKSFIPESGLSLNGNYYTFKGGDIWRHHSNIVNRASFYGSPMFSSYIDVLFNQLPGVVKNFGSLNYEGSQAKITLNTTDGEYYNNTPSAGWFVHNGNTDLEESSQLEFKNKEGKWFSNMKGKAINNIVDIDSHDFTFQGIGMAQEIGDCNGDLNGTAYIDLCGTCVEGNTGLLPCPEVLGCVSDTSACNHLVSGGNITVSPLVAGVSCCQDPTNNPCSGNLPACANVDDGSCIAIDCNNECGGGAYIDNCNNCVGGNTGQTACVIVYGCTNSGATNYDPNATDDDGTCQYGPVVYGCTDDTASTTTNGSPDVNGNGTDGQPCDTPTSTPLNGQYYPCETGTGVYGYNATNYNPLATIDNGSCCYEGCMDFSASNYNPNAQGVTVCVDDGSCIHVNGCTDPLACNYDPLATLDDGSCEVPTLICDICSGSIVITDPSCVAGCNDPMATNYDPLATIDDGSCTYIPISSCISPLTTTANTGNAQHPWTIEGAYDSLTVSDILSNVTTEWLPTQPTTSLAEWIAVNPGASGHFSYIRLWNSDYYNTGNQSTWLNINSYSGGSASRTPKSLSSAEISGIVANLSPQQNNLGGIPDPTLAAFRLYGEGDLDGVTYTHTDKWLQTAYIKLDGLQINAQYDLHFWMNPDLDNCSANGNVGRTYLGMDIQNNIGNAYNDPQIVTVNSVDYKFILPFGELNGYGTHPTIMAYNGRYADGTVPYNGGQNLQWSTFCIAAPQGGPGYYATFTATQEDNNILAFSMDGGTYMDFYNVKVVCRSCNFAETNSYLNYQTWNTVDQMLYITTVDSASQYNNVSSWRQTVTGPNGQTFISVEENWDDSTEFEIENKNWGSGIYTFEVEYIWAYSEDLTSGATPECTETWTVNITAGCTDPGASNFDPTADYDDGSCTI